MADAGTANSDRKRAVLMARAQAGDREADYRLLEDITRFRNHALQPVPRHGLDHLIAACDRGRRDRGKRLRAGAEASTLAGDPGVAVIQARPSDA